MGLSSGWSAPLVATCKRCVETCAELTTEAEVTLYLTEPVGEVAGIGECRPHLVDARGEAVLNAHNASAIG